jgi:hypothetical protein
MPSWLVLFRTMAGDVGAPTFAAEACISASRTCSPRSFTAAGLCGTNTTVLPAPNWHVATHNAKVVAMAKTTLYKGGWFPWLSGYTAEQHR